MKKYPHWDFHFQTLMICSLTIFIVNFYLYMGSIGLSGGIRTALCALIIIGTLAYRYWSWGSNLSVRDRCSLREFLIGMIPAQIVHVLFYVFIYFVFAFLYRHFLYELFEVLRLGNVAIFTFVMGWAFALMGHRIFVLSMESFGCVMALLAVSIVFYILISYICYIWGVATHERERRDMIQGIQRKKRAPFVRSSHSSSASRRSTQRAFLWARWPYRRSRPSARRIPLCLAVWTRRATCSARGG